MKNTITALLISLTTVSAFSQTEAPKFLSFKAMKINTIIREVPEGGVFISNEDSAAQVLLANTIITDVLTGNLKAFDNENEGQVLDIDEVKQRVAGIDSTFIAGKNGKGKYLTSFPLVTSMRLTEKWTYSGSEKSLSKIVTRIDFMKKFFYQGEYMGPKIVFYVKLAE